VKPLLILIGSFLVILLITRVNGRTDMILSGNAAMSIMLVITAIGHFKYGKGMAMMLPGIVPYKKQVVVVSGIFEFIAAIGLLFPDFRLLTASLLILFFIAIIPANINAAVNRVDIYKGNNEGSGKNYLWFRIPLQVLFILWVWYFGTFLE
jgi:uncharacterized membrane protein